MLTRCLYSGKMVVFGQSGCIREKWLYSRICCIWAECLYSSKVVVFWQNGCIRAKWLYSGKVVAFM